MDDFRKKLQEFLENDCPGKISDCENCPGNHYLDLKWVGNTCVHPKHPSMQDKEIVFPKDKSESA